MTLIEAQYMLIAKNDGVDSIEISESSTQLHLHKYFAKHPSTAKALDDIYHSTSVSEIRIKADLHGIDLDDVNVLLHLIVTTVYHDAYWPHTHKRYIALKRLLRSGKGIEHASRSQELYSYVKKEYDTLLDPNNPFYYINATLGRKQQKQNYAEILSIISKPISRKVEMHESI